MFNIFWKYNRKEDCLHEYDVWVILVDWYIIKIECNFCLMVFCYSVVKVVSFIHGSRTADKADVLSNANFQ